MYYNYIRQACFFLFVRLLYYCQQYQYYYEYPALYLCQVLPLICRSCLLLFRMSQRWHCVLVLATSSAKNCQTLEQVKTAPDSLEVRTTSKTIFSCLFPAILFLIVSFTDFNIILGQYYLVLLLVLSSFFQWFMVVVVVDCFLVSIAFLLLGVVSGWVYRTQVGLLASRLAQASLRVRKSHISRFQQYYDHHIHHIQPSQYEEANNNIYLLEIQFYSSVQVVPNSM